MIGMGKAVCCWCCVAAEERGELDHSLDQGCIHPPCDFCVPRKPGQRTGARFVTGLTGGLQ